MERDQNVTMNTNNFVWRCQISQSTKQRWVGFDGYEAHFFSFVYYWQQLSAFTHGDMIKVLKCKLSIRTEKMI